MPADLPRDGGLRRCAGVPWRLDASAPPPPWFPPVGHSPGRVLPCGAPPHSPSSAWLAARWPIVLWPYTAPNGHIPVLYSGQPVSPPAPLGTVVQAFPSAVCQRNCSVPLLRRVAKTVSPLSGLP